MIELHNISKNFITPSGIVEALKNISLQVNKGEIFGVMGRSGAGKSTLIRSVNLLECPDAGKVIVNGIDLTALPEQKLIYERRHIGMIFQHFNLLQSRTVFNNIALPLEILKQPKDKIKKRVDELLDFIGLSDKRKNYPQELSGGQKQRVAIARALANAPKVLLCDEATSSLDPEATDLTLKLLKTVRDEFGLTIMLITHEMDVIRKVCDRTCILDRGEIIETGPTSEIFTHPKSDIAKNFVYSNLHVNLPDAIRQKMKAAPDANTLPVVRFTFKGNQTEEPILLELYKKFNVTCNILQANFSWVQEANIGVCICELSGEDSKINEGIAFARSQNIETEVLGHVHQ